ncbi:MAG: hypothetical protein EXR75_08790 [Myxococcales bacterium]|nr:hypothetical protein [Myxococcales bacterium]
MKTRPSRPADEDPLMKTRLMKTLARLGLGLPVVLALLGGWLACAPRDASVAELLDLSAALPQLAAPAPAATSAATALPQDTLPKTVADVLADNTICTTDAVRALSEEIIAEANCLRPGTYVKLSESERTVFAEAVFPYLLEPARDALVLALATRKGKLTLSSMLRTVAQQYLLHEWYKAGRCGIKLAAEPGRSNHQSGLAIDVANPEKWRVPLTARGFRWLGKKDRWHFDFVGRARAEKNAAKRLAPELAGLDVKAFQRLHNLNAPTADLAETGDFDEATADALRRAPALGFAAGPSCSAVGPPGARGEPNP